MKNWRIFSTRLRSERDAELFIGGILRFGVILSCVITLLGGVVYLFQRHGAAKDYSAIAGDAPFPGADDYLRELSTLLPRVLAGDGAAIIQLGVCVLIATPVIRVAFSAIAFLIGKDYLYVAITLIVLAIILLNMLLGIH
jgi:uncharacterized membrane protein